MTIVLISFLLAIVSVQVDACTRILVSKDPNEAVMVGRNMDWYEEMDTNIVFYPRNTPRYGGEATHPDETWISWDSKYATLVATGYEDFTTDGLNEEGFAAHILWLEDSDYGQRDLSKPALSLTLWAQYYLDNFKTVREAIEHTRNTPFQVVPFFHEVTQQWGELHLALDDATGDSAILEYVDGKLNIHHDSNFIVLTNEPAYEVQLQNLKNYKVFGGENPLPGDTDSIDRFVRGTHFTNVLSKSEQSEELLTGTLSILSNVSQPYGSVGDRTIWRTVADLKKRVYYFQGSQNQNLISVTFDAIPFDQGVSMKLDLTDHPEYRGDASHLFKKIK